MKASILDLVLFGFNLYLAKTISSTWAEVNVLIMLVSFIAMSVVALMISDVDRSRILLGFKEVPTSLIVSTIILVLSYASTAALFSYWLLC